MKPSRRTALAVLVSLALHGALLLWAFHQPIPPPQPTPPERDTLEWVEVEVIPSPAVEPPAEPREARPAPKKPRAPAAKPASEQREAQRTPPPEAPTGPSEAAPPPPEPIAQTEPPAGNAPRGERPEVPSPAAAEAGSEEAPGLAAGPSAGATDDTPSIAAEGPGLVPVIPGVGGSRANEFASLSKGRTIRNGEGEAPDLEALAQMNAEQARRRVQGFALDELAAARVRGGVVDGYFGDMKKALQRTTENPPKFTEGATFVHDLVEAWSAGASQWAKTGNPYAEGKTGEGSAARDANNPLEQRRNARVGGVGSALDGDPESDFLNKQEAAARLREFADGRFGQGIIALVEIRQQRDGGLEGVALVRSSGNRLFDKHVLTTAPLAIAKLEAAPSQGQGIHPDGIRTLWAFEGRILFKRKVDPKTLTVKDWAGIAGQGLLSGLTNGWIPGSTGNFDETTGEMEIVDLTNPRFTCTPRLLRIY